MLKQTSGHCIPNVSSLPTPTMPSDGEYKLLPHSLVSKEHDEEIPILKTPFARPRACFSIRRRDWLITTQSIIIFAFVAALVWTLEARSPGQLLLYCEYPPRFLLCKYRVNDLPCGQLQQRKLSLTGQGYFTAMSCSRASTRTRRPRQ